MTNMFNDLSAADENKKLEELFLAIYFNDIDKVIEFRNQYPEIYAKKDCFIIEGNTTFDLTNLTYFNRIIWNDINWIEEIMPLVNKHKLQSEQMSDLWHAESGLKNIYRPFEYNRYWDYFYCDDPNDYEEIIMDPISVYLEKGFREIDLKLYNRTQCFDFLETRKLLEQGANSEVHFENDGDSSTLSRILSERSYLATCCVCPEYKIFESNGYLQDYYIRSMFGDLLGLAAHVEMYSLLEEYKNNNRL